MATPNPQKPPATALPPPPIPQQQQASSQAHQQQQQPPLLAPNQHPSALQDASLRKYMYTSSLAILVACPVIALLPPRKMDFYTFGLGVAWCMSAEYAMEHRTGRGLLWHVSARLPSAKQERARMEQAAAEEREAEVRRVKEAERVRAAFREEREKRERERGWFGRLLGGKVDKGEEEDWVEERAEREREAAEEGRGYGSLIVGQVRDVVWGKEEEVEDDDDEEEEEKKNNG